MIYILETASGRFFVVKKKSEISALRTELRDLKDEVIEVHKERTGFEILNSKISFKSY